MVAVWFLRVSIWVLRAIWVIVVATTLIEVGLLAFHFTLNGTTGARKWITDTYGRYRLEGDFIYQPSPDRVYREFATGLLWQFVSIVVAFFLSRFLKRLQHNWANELGHNYQGKVLSISPERASSESKPNVSRGST